MVRASAANPGLIDAADSSAWSVDGACCRMSHYDWPHAVSRRPRSRGGVQRQWLGEAASAAGAAARSEVHRESCWSEARSVMVCKATAGVPSAPSRGGSTTPGRSRLDHGTVRVRWASGRAPTALGRCRWWRGIGWFPRCSRRCCCFSAGRRPGCCRKRNCPGCPQGAEWRCPRCRGQSARP